jgi:hypothetical protein
MEISPLDIKPLETIDALLPTDTYTGTLGTFELERIASKNIKDSQKAGHWVPLKGPYFADNYYFAIPKTGVTLPASQCENYLREWMEEKGWAEKKFFRYFLSEAAIKRIHDKYSSS